MVFAKGSRFERSSSLGKITLFGRIIPIESADDFFERKKPGGKEPFKEVERPVFTIGSPERDEGLKKNGKEKEGGEGFLEFLQKCSLCKKALKGDVYMYGNLGAFCSEECREDRMDLDGFNQEMEKEFKEMAESYRSLEHKIKSLGVAARLK